MADLSLGYLPLAHLNLTRRPRPQGDWRRLGDLVIAGALIALFLPLICIVALAIKCDSQGPVFARQGRGSRGRRFAALTFRTTAAAGVDDSLTRVGWFLEYTCMDSLPRLINVLRGEMTCINAGSELPFFLD
jgi:lipopolysaccharide/colanic/teichoic acid biosynthesis glycosyltransferase